MPLAPAGHPIWKLANLIVILVFLTVFLYLNATKFDQTEMKSIIYMAMALGGWEFAKHKAAKRAAQQEKTVDGKG